MTGYLSVDQVLSLHKELVADFGGSTGLRDRGALEAAVARPRATFGGEDLYVDLADKAAALMHSLVLNHPFVDGNKRIAAHSAELFCLLNGETLLARDEEVIAVTLKAAEGKIAVEALAIWFRQRLKARPE